MIWKIKFELNGIIRTVKKEGSDEVEATEVFRDVWGFDARIISMEAQVS
tara:strand:- start:144 stop:290 length:147 start_codon:yes stop_codon:yes gene_type:complete